MEYPRWPSFDNIFWYQVVTDDGSVWVCSISGYEFVAELQRVLSTAGIMSQPSYDGLVVSSSDVAIDLKWGPTTQRVLWLVARAVGLPQTWIDWIEHDGRAHTLLASSVYSAAYVIMTLSARSGLFIESGTGPEVIRVQAFDPPRWETIPPMVTHGTPGNIMCTLQVQSATPGVPTVAPGEPAEPAVPPAPAPGTPPVLPIPVGQPATRVNLNVPAGRIPTTVTQEGISWGPILLVGGLIVGTIIVAGQLRQKPLPALKKAKGKKS